MRRRRQNRKKASAGFIFPTPLATILVMAAGLSLGYLWLCGRCEALGKRITVLEEQRAVVHKRRLLEEYKWHNMKSWPKIELALARHGLAMDWPEANRVVVIPYSACRLDGPQGAREKSRDMRIAMK